MICYKNLLAYFLVLGVVFCEIKGSSLRNYEIARGQDALEGQFPYQVSIQERRDEDYKSFCGGSIISPNWIVTAGHCYLENTNPDVRIVAGIIKISETSESMQVRTIAKYYIHEDYHGGPAPNDIMVMKVNEPFIFNDRVKPINLPKQNFETIGEAVISGWGNTDKELEPDNLQWELTQISDGQTCIGQFGNIFNETTNVCSENLKQGQGPCSGDSGGPLAQHGTLIGVVSWGSKDCGTDIPSVYSKVSNYIDWIKEHVSEL
ncbi:trypsin-1 [Diabrotica virgifera virgifera]|uniref:Trypsin-1-like n=1 Tax=Diabrotica virgifera virgifera TaxID=50390 RepID=A0A6P7FF20_DIAVI|nr:trypsin-1 [Diabrotica virgifera virgifera]